MHAPLQWTTQVAVTAVRPTHNNNRHSSVREHLLGIHKANNSSGAWLLAELGWLNGYEASKDAPSGQKVSKLEPHLHGLASPRLLTMSGYKKKNHTPGAEMFFVTLLLLRFRMTRQYYL